METPAFITAINGIVFPLLFLIAVLVVTVYTVFLAYHWFAYGTSKALSLQALVIHLAISAGLLLIMAIMIQFV